MKNPRLLYLVVIVPLLSLCTWFGVQFGDLIHQGLSTLSWPKTTGQVTSSSLRDYDSDTGRSRLDIEVPYQVNGRAFTCRRVRFGPYTVRGDDQATTDSFKVGSIVPVAYDPDSPDRSVLLPGPAGNSIAGLLFAIVADLLLFREVRRIFRPVRFRTAAPRSALASQ